MKMYGPELIWEIDTIIIIFCYYIFVIVPVFANFPLNTVTKNKDLVNNP